jgi:hypothetical protein
VINVYKIYFIDMAEGTELEAEERCRAVTRAGTQCSRIAQDDGFCYQHDSSSRTVGNGSTDASDSISSRVNQSLDSLQADLKRNINDIQGGVEDLIQDLREGNTDPQSAVFRAIPKTAGNVAPRTSLVGGIGMIAGAPLGPLGVAVGGSAGLVAGFYLDAEEDRALVAVHVDEVPDSVDPTPSDHPVISEFDAIPLVIRSAIDSNGEDWIRNTATRHEPVGEILARLEEELPYTEGYDDFPNGFYLKDIESGEAVVLMIEDA